MYNGKEDMGKILRPPAGDVDEVFWRLCTVAMPRSLVTCSEWAGFAVGFLSTKASGRKIFPMAICPYGYEL